MRDPTETQEGIALANWLRGRVVDGAPVVFLHIPNERRGDARTYALCKMLGIQKGFPDYLLLTRTAAAPHGAAVELKTRDGGKKPAEQRAWIRALNMLGIRATFSDGAQEAVQWLEGLGY